MNLTDKNKPVRIGQFLQQMQEGKWEDATIRTIIDITKSFTKEERFRKAKFHLYDALQFEDARPLVSTSSQKMGLQNLKKFRSSYLWRSGLYYLSYIFMYLVIFDHESWQGKIIVEGIILIVFLADTIIETISVEETDKPSKKKGFTYFKLLVFTFMWADIILLFLTKYQHRPLTPFRIFRVCIPVFYDRDVRRWFICLFKTYQDILVFLIFYLSTIFIFAVLGSNIIQISQQTQYDEYTQNYASLQKMIFIMYVNSSYDSYPDNQILAIEASEWYYAFFIIFVFLNMFVFTTIPGSLIFQFFREYSSKLIIQQQIEQQRSLVLAFYTLTGENYLNMTILLDFLNYLYFHNKSYVEFLIGISLRLDRNNNKVIECQEFLNLIKIMNENPRMMPPNYRDLECWVNFRSFVNQNINLYQIVDNIYIQVTIGILVLLDFINTIIYMITNESVSGDIGLVIICIFVIDVFLKVVAKGISQYFSDNCNQLDALLVSIMFFLTVFVQMHINQPDEQKLSRIFRLSIIFRFLTYRPLVGLATGFIIYQKLRKLLSNILIILPLLLKFFPIFLLVFYFLGIVGMQIFFQDGFMGVTKEEDKYDQFSNFKGFINTQYIMVQILTEAGWSTVAYDHAHRNPNHFFFVMLYFVLCHFAIVLMVSPLIRGLFWQIYFCVHMKSQAKEKEARQSLKKQKEMLENSTIDFVRSIKRLDSRAIDEQQQIEIQITNLEKVGRRRSSSRFDKRAFWDYMNCPLRQKDQDEKDYFIEFLRSKFIKPLAVLANRNPFNSESSPKSLLKRLNEFLNIECELKHIQKKQLIEYLIQTGGISRQEGEVLLSGNLYRVYNFESTNLIKDVFLHELNQDMINQFQKRALRRIFRQDIQKISQIDNQVQLKSQALLMFAFRNMLRYSDFNTPQFHYSLYHLEQQISQKLFSLGSIFKFVFQLKEEDHKNRFFIIECEKADNIVIKRLNSQKLLDFGELQPRQIYYAKDYFSLTIDDERQLKKSKQFKGTSESLITLLTQNGRIDLYSPIDYAYDAFFSLYKTDTAPFIGNYSIGRIFTLIMLRKQQRSIILNDNLYDIPVILFPTQNLGEMEEEQFNYSEFQRSFNKQRTIVRHADSSLQLSQTLNLMQQINQIFELKGKNMINHVETVLREKYNEISGI